MDSKIASLWGRDWVWSLPLIAATVSIHVIGLGLAYRRLSLVLAGNGNKRPHLGVPALIMGGLALFATILHGVEGSIWAAAYLLLGAVHDRRSAMLYSLGAMTTYGKADVYLDSRWQLMGPLEALDGWILFGLTTAFLLAVIQNIWNAPKRST
jgi:hypothetical protein